MCIHLNVLLWTQIKIHFEIITIGMSVLIKTCRDWVAYIPKNTIQYVFSTFLSIFITFHEGTRRPGGVRYRREDFKGNALHWDRRFGYDIRKCPIYRGRYMRGFLLELSLDGTGTWVSVRYKQLSGLSEDVIREVYCSICSGFMAQYHFLFRLSFNWILTDHINESVLIFREILARTRSLEKVPINGLMEGEEYFTQNYLKLIN